MLYSLNILSSVTSQRCPSPRLCARAHNQGCSGGESLATCGRFDRFGIWIPYLPYQRQTSYNCTIWPPWLTGRLLKILLDVIWQSMQWVGRPMGP